ncbi:MAG TPA: hypothetical protein VKA34_21930 [Balneolales bacterium]|nr:hypothetical protein [Balneolales bacterium]
MECSRVAGVRLTTTATTATGYRIGRIKVLKRIVLGMNNMLLKFHTKRIFTD